MREKAINHIEQHIKKYKEARENGHLATEDLRYAKVVGLLSMAKELGLITTEEYFDHLQKMES